MDYRAIVKKLSETYNFDYREAMKSIGELLPTNVIVLPAYLPRAGAWISKKRGASAYTSLFYNGINNEESERIGDYHTTIHSDKIKAGNKLEKDIFHDLENYGTCEIYHKKNVEDFPNLNYPCVIFACQFSKTWYQSFKLTCKNKKCIEIDFVYISKDRSIHLFELKNGCNFDTKKSKGEAQSLEATKQGCLKCDFVTAKCGIVCYDAKKIQDISLKTELGDVEIMLYEDFCKIVGLDGSASRGRIEQFKQQRAQFELQKVDEFVHSHPDYKQLEQKYKALEQKYKMAVQIH